MEPSNRQGAHSYFPWERIFLDTLLFELSTPIRTRVLLALSLFICLFLIIFQPFNLHNSSIEELLQTSIGSAVIFFLVGYLLNSLRANGYWVFVGRPLVAELAYVMLFIFLVGLLVYLLRLNSEHVELSWGSALQFQTFAFIMAIVSIFISRLLTSLIKLHREIRTRNELQRTTELEIEGRLITLALAGGEEEFSFPFEKWIAAKAAGNYIELYFNTCNHKPMILVRSTLKALTGAMQQEDRFFQCHRSFVININYVSRLNGSSQSHKLELKGLANPVPVARSSEKELLQKLQLQSTSL